MRENKVDIDLCCWIVLKVSSLCYSYLREQVMGVGEIVTRSQTEHSTEGFVCM